MLFLVHGTDAEGVDEILQARAEEHWSYMDRYADRLVARGPTLTPDGDTHTGSVHVVDLDSAEDARRFALEEPYHRAGAYAAVSVARLQPALSGTMWDRPAAAPGAVSTLALVRWLARRPGPAQASEGTLLPRIAGIERLVFGGLLVDEEGTSTTGLVVAVDGGVADARAGLALLEHPPAAASTVTRWRRGGRHHV